MNEEQAIARDQSVPTARRVAVSVWLFVALALICFWGLGYLDTYGGGFDPRVYEPFRSVEFVEHLPAPKGGNEVFDRGRRLYTEKGCVACHQPSGLGNPSGNIPPLAGSDWVNAEGPNRIIRVVLNGFTGPIEVGGKPFNGATMTPFGGILSDDELAAVLTFARGNKDWGNNAGPVTPEQVKAIRNSTKDHPGNWTPPELLAIPTK